MAKQPLKQRITRTVNVEHTLNRPRKGAKLREEVWQTDDGKVVKYNLAYINHRVCGVDNGRVLGYDSSHGQHHRHFMGTVEPVEFKSYEAIVDRFRQELDELWRCEDEKN